MKLTNLILGFALTSLTIGMQACKKTTASTTTDEFETTFELSGDQAVTDYVIEDANDILNEAAIENNFSGNRLSDQSSATQTMNLLSCASVTVTPLQGFPKNIVLDFGTGCTSGNGVTRKGKILIAISDSLRKSGSVAVMTFDGFYVNNFKKEGTITWTNTSSAGTKSWQRKAENGKITAPDGKYWLHSGTKNIVQVAGVTTPHNLLDDVYSITGDHTVTNAAGKTRTSTIIEALEKKVICENIDKGKVKIQGPNHFAVLDYGDGTCDRVATISIDGRDPRTILLR
ncbi:MAG: hypothetical protein ABJA57_00125 [Ginsengibacter sp.]